MPKAKPTSSTLMDLEWARVYADRIKDELKLIAKTLSDLNAHAMHPHLATGAVALKAQMKEASQQVGSMRKIASQYESNWMSTIKKALARKYPGVDERKSGRKQDVEEKIARRATVIVARLTVLRSLGGARFRTALRRRQPRR